MIDTCWFIWNLCIDSRSEACWNDAISTGWPLTWRKNVNAIPMGLINLISGGGVRICKRQAGPTILSINKFIQNQLVKHNSKTPFGAFTPTDFEPLGLVGFPVGSFEFDAAPMMFQVNVHIQRNTSAIFSNNISQNQKCVLFPFIESIKGSPSISHAGK